MNFYEVPAPEALSLLDRLAAGVARIGIRHGHQRHPGCDWCVLEAGNGSQVQILPSQKSLEFKFEVFPLAFSDRIPDAKDIVWRAFVLEGTVEVTPLFTEEWLDPDAICGPSYGQNPILQCRGFVGSAPPSATAVCRYLGAVELSGANGESIFIASGSFPLTLHVEGLADDESVVRRHYRAAAHF